jgi:hypothetical protein
MSTQTVPVATEPGLDLGLSHWTCCVGLKPDTALCGADVSNHEQIEFDHASCVVCDDLYSQLICPWSERRCSEGVEGP